MSAGRSWGCSIEMDEPHRAVGDTGLGVAWLLRAFRLQREGENAYIQK